VKPALPPPLTQEQAALVLEGRPYALRFAKLYLRRMPYLRRYADDIYGLAMEGLVWAAIKFDPEVGTLAGCIWWQVRAAILNSRRGLLTCMTGLPKSMRPQDVEMLSLDAEREELGGQSLYEVLPAESDESEVDMDAQVHGPAVLERLPGELRRRLLRRGAYANSVDRTVVVFMDYLLKGGSLREIGERCGVSHEAVRKAVDRTDRVFQEWLAEERGEPRQSRAKRAA
jgi:hypothetical protein